MTTTTVLLLVINCVISVWQLALGWLPINLLLVGWLAHQAIVEARR